MLCVFIRLGCATKFAFENDPNIIELDDTKASNDETAKMGTSLGLGRGLIYCIVMTNAWCYSMNKLSSRSLPKILASETNVDRMKERRSLGKRWEVMTNTEIRSEKESSANAEPLSPQIHFHTQHRLLKPV